LIDAHKINGGSGRNGIRNFGNSYYLNNIIQVLFQTKQLINYFVYNSQPQAIDKEELTIILNLKKFKKMIEKNIISLLKYYF